MTSPSTSEMLTPGGAIHAHQARTTTAADPHSAATRITPAEAIPARGTVADAASTPRVRRTSSPIGRIEIVGNGAAITSLTIERDGLLPHDAHPESDDEILHRAVAQLAEYFAGTRKDFELPIETGGTPFQQSVWNELSTLGWGTVTSYGQIGQATGRSTAGRAVGGAVGANPIPIIVPCHRVLASNRKITGYSAGSGIPTKVWLLDHEGIPHL